jgi:acyl-CoA synthetase (AMP-forming)/AMP-acid ligase II/acyl carrier protein
VDRRQVEQVAAALLPAPRAVGILTRLPRDAEGRVDQAALDALPLLDDVVARRFAGALVASGASDAAATLQPAPPAAGERLHLWDMVPELARSAEVESTSSTEQGASRAEAEVPLPAGPVAWHDGGPLSVPEDAPRTLSEALLLAARRSEATGRGLTVVESGRGSRQRSYARLVDDARAVLGGLQAAGLRPGDRLVLQLPSLHDHFTAFWACVLGGITPVTVAPPPSYDLPNAVLAKLFNAWRLLRHPPVLTHADRQAPLARAAASYAADDAVPFRTLAFETLASGEPGELHAASPEDLVFFQLTSGSTGIPKCVPETHRAVSRHVLGATAFNRYGPDDCSVNWLPLDHVVPTLTSHLRDVFLGIPQVHAETAWVLADPLRWLDLLEEHRATITWSPNFGFKLVSQAVAANPHRRWDLSRVRSMMNAGEQVTLAVVEELLARTAAFGIRPEAMQPAYGMAEVATAVTFRNGFSLETATCRVRKASLGALLEDATPDEVGSVAFIDNGPPIPGVELRIADHRGRALPERMIGRIQMRGGVVNPGYLDNPEANADAFVGDGWFDSGDLGFFRDRHLFITGRRKEIIIVRGANFYCYEIEDVVNAVEGVEPSFAAVTSIDDPASGTEGLAVFFVPRTAGAGVNARLVAAVREAVTRTFGVRPAFTLPLNREEFPKTTSGKIQRADLKKRLAAGDLDARIREVDRAEAAPTTVPSWFSRPGWAPRPPSDRPFDLAGTWLVDLGADLLSGARALDLAAATAELAAGATPAAVVVPCAGDGAALLPLVQAILASSAPPHLIVLAPEGGAAVGLVLTLAQENPAVRCRVVEGVGGVDLAAAIRAKPASAGADGRAVEGVRGVDLAAAIQAELASPGAEPRVRWSNGRREVRRLRPFVPGGSALPLRRGGAYVLVGGLGGVGRALAAMLLRRFEARLLLLGRTPLEGGAAADADLETLAASASGEERRNALAALARLPGEVTYVPLDASDPDAVRAALARWGHPPDGAFHLAGRFPIRLLAEERAEGWRAVHHSKVDTFAALDAALPSGAFIVAMGSVYAELGTAAGGAYASAGSALAAAAAARATRGAPTWHVAWSHWDDVGMSRSFAFREEARALGLHMLAPSEALTSLLAVLAGPPGDVVVGLDPACPHAGWRTDLPAAPAEAVIAAAAGGSGRPAPVPDRLGRPIQGTILSCEQVPRGVDGALDVEALGALASGGAAARPYAAPSSALERTIAAAWCEALGVERVDVDTSYFALGGQSVQLVQVLARLEASLGRKLSVVDLFRWPTVRGLARFLAQAEGGGEQARLEQAQDRGRRLRQVRRTAPTHGKPR